MKKIFFLSLAVIFTAVCSFAQTASWKNLRHSVYLGGGVNVYFGDLGHAKETSHAYDSISFYLRINLLNHQIIILIILSCHFGCWNNSHFAT